MERNTVAFGFIAYSTLRFRKNLFKYRAFNFNCRFQFDVLKRNVDFLLDKQK